MSGQTDNRHRDTQTHWSQ